MILHESFGPLACGLVALVGLGCGMDPGQGTGSTEGTASATSTASADESTTMDDECQWGYDDDYVVLLGIVDGTVQWSTYVENEQLDTVVAAVPDLEGGIIFGTWAPTQLVRHGADGNRIAALAVHTGVQSLATDGNGRLVYGVFDSGQAGYVELDPLLNPLGPQHPLPWSLVSVHNYDLEIGIGPDGTIVAAGGDSNGEGRFISQLDAEGNELWTSAWPIGSQPDETNVVRVAGVGVLDDGTVGMALDSRDVWLEAFDPSGQHLWAQTAPNRGTMDMFAVDDTFVVTSDNGVDAFGPDGSPTWSIEAEPRGRARPCPDGTFVMAKNTGYVSFTPGGSLVEHDLDPFSYIPPTDDHLAAAEGSVGDALCSTDGVVIVLVGISVYHPPQGDCATGG